MKNLTHYFNSPKEENNIAQEASILPENCVSNEEKISKKSSKLSLSKRKKSKQNIVEDECSTNTENQISNSNTLLSNGMDRPLSNKKRKIEKESINKTDTKKAKNEKSIKTKSSDYATKANESQNIVNEPTMGISRKKGNKNHINENNSCNIVEQHENSSCDSEPILQIKKKKRLTLLLDDSDEEFSAEEKESMTTSKSVTTENGITEKSPPSKNSIFSYFNKVDKETALEKKSEKIKVQALIHLPPNEENKPKHKSSLSKPIAKKTNKNKQLDNSDCIEVISSEYIEDGSSLSEKTDTQVCLVNNQVEGISVKEETNKKIQKINNVASIFLTKKSVQVQETEESKVKNKCNTSSDISDNTDKLVQDGTKKNKSKNAEQNKLLKTNRKSKSDKKLDDNTRKDVTNDNKEQSSKKIGGEFVDGTYIKTKSNNSKYLPAFCNVKNESEVIHSKENKKVPDISNKNKDNSSNDSLEKCNLLNKSTELTPKKKLQKINGYFTPKQMEPTSETKNSQVKSKISSKKVHSPWVMKVRINSASKSTIDTNKSPKVANGETKEEKFVGKNVINEDEEDEIVMLEDEDDSSDCHMKSEKRISIPRNAKNAVLLQAENSESESSNHIAVLDKDEDNSSDSCQEIPQQRKSLSKGAKRARPLESEESEIDSPKPSIKMWPFFQKRGAKGVSKEPTVDPARLKARQLFLESGVPDIIKRKVESEKSEIAVGIPAPFPTFSHVTQFSSKSVIKETKSLLPRIRCPSPLKIPDWSSVVSSEEAVESEIPVFDRPENVKAILEKIKEEEPKTDVKALYKKLKEYKSKAESNIWTDIYKPTKSADMVGNSETIKKLKTWLETFKNRRNREGSISSGDEFVADDSDGESSNSNNLAIITGPCGCGKTCAIYAMAAELDYKVLEINASCNRSGKRILAEFSESTQSHQVERTQPLNSIFNNHAGKKKKKKKSKHLSETKSEKTSLILVEDADILFTDTDEGFMPALSSLAATAKRPLILVTNKTQNPHMDRFQSSRPLHLTFDKPKASKLSLWLRLLGLVEGVVIPPELANRLVMWSGCDVRKALLQLQLMVHSNNSEIKEEMTESYLWWCWPAMHHLKFELPTLLEPEETSVPAETEKQLVIKQLEALVQTTSGLAYLDVLSSKLQRKNSSWQEGPCQMAWQAKYTDSTSLEPRKESTVGDSTSQDMATWLAQEVAKENQIECQRTGQTAQEARWLSILRQGEQMYLSGVSPTMHTNHQSIVCDYLPTLREIGRAEQVRLVNYTRRANRFFNYLQGLNISASKSYRDFMCDVFS